MLIDFEEIKHKLNNSKWYGTQAWYEILDIIGDCDNKSRPKGEWLRDFSGNEFYWYCSNCKEEYYEEDLYIGGNEFPYFCPNCGADMRGEE